MIRNRTLFVGLFAAAACVAFAQREASADDYVWARSAWGNGSWGRNYGSMTNGYGGYYVPRNAYGNNFEGRQITNPNGYIVPAGSPSSSAYTKRRWFHR